MILEGEMRRISNQRVMLFVVAKAPEAQWETIMVWLLMGGQVPQNNIFTFS